MNDFDDFLTAHPEERLLHDEALERNEQEGQTRLHDRALADAADDWSWAMKSWRGQRKALRKRFDRQFQRGEQTVRARGTVFDRRRFFVPALAGMEDDGSSVDTELSEAEQLFMTYAKGGERFEVTGTSDEKFFNAVSSEIVSAHGIHAPALDIDHHCRLIPSSTPGHYHLYIEVAMPWWRYRLLLWAMVHAGVIEPGYYRAAVLRRATFLRKPHYFKEEMQRQTNADELVALRTKLRGKA